MRNCRWVTNVKAILWSVSKAVHLDIHVSNLVSFAQKSTLRVGLKTFLASGRWKTRWLWQIRWQLGDFLPGFVDYVYFETEAILNKKEDQIRSPIKELTFTRLVMPLLDCVWAFFAGFKKQMWPFPLFHNLILGLNVWLVSVPIFFVYLVLLVFMYVLLTVIWYPL